MESIENPILSSHVFRSTPPQLTEVRAKPALVRCRNNAISFRTHHQQQQQQQRV
jgi:hypothetical protein